MIVQNMSEVESHLGDVDPRWLKWLKPSYHPRHSSKLHHNGESDIGYGMSKGRQQISSKAATSTLNTFQLTL